MLDTTPVVWYNKYVIKKRLQKKGGQNDKLYIRNDKSFKN